MIWVILEGQENTNFLLHRLKRQVQRGPKFLLDDFISKDVLADHLRNDSLWHQTRLFEEDVTFINTSYIPYGWVRTASPGTGN